MKNKILIANLILAIVSVSFFALSFVKPTKADVSFDHSTCQYPYRASNPADGCDNSDPACPEIIKGGTCSNEKPEWATPYVPTVTTPAPVTTAPKGTCNE